MADGAGPVEPQGGEASAEGGRGASVGSRLDLRDVFYVLGLITLVITVLTLAAEYLAPMTLAILLWFLVNAVAKGMEGVPVLRVLPPGVLRGVAAVAILFVLYLAGRLVVSNISELSAGLQGLDVKANEALGSIVASIEATIGIAPNIEDPAKLLEQFGYREILNEVVSYITTTASNLSVVLLFVLFLLLDQPYFEAKIAALFPNGERRSRVQAVLAQIGRDTRTYVWIMTLMSLIVGLATYAICSYFELRGAAFWGFLAFALNYIPTIGTFLGVLFPAIFGLVQFDSLGDTAGMIAALGIVQFIVGNLILPRVTSNSLNLSEFVVILSLLVWGAMWGVAGMFLAVPMMMVLLIVLSQFDSTRPVAILLSKTGRIRSR